jgi:hypothetical protein
VAVRIGCRHIFLPLPVQGPEAVAVRPDLPIGTIGAIASVFTAIFIEVGRLRVRLLFAITRRSGTWPEALGDPVFSIWYQEGRLAGLKLPVGGGFSSVARVGGLIPGAQDQEAEREEYQ